MKLQEKSPSVKLPGVEIITLGNSADSVIIDSGSIKFGDAWTKSSHGYAVRRLNGKNVYMHRLLMGSPHGKQVDHINGNKLDNRLSNLRIATAELNAANNRRLWAKSGLKGAYRNRGKWISRLNLGGKDCYLGVFDTAQEAHEAYKRAKSEYWTGKGVAI